MFESSFFWIKACLLLILGANALQLLRYGGSWGIESGRRGTREILSFWEQSGCLITDSQSVHKCSDKGRVMHEARMNGLATLLQSIFSSVGQVM
jgi:hypothetical protein